MMYNGMRVLVKDAQEQARTPRDVRGAWVRPGRVPSRLAGRKGTRRAWKRRNQPGWSWLYREPTDVLVIKPQSLMMSVYGEGRSAGSEVLIVTPRQWAELKRQTVEAHHRDYGQHNPIFQGRIFF